jgi:hypothetical protein
MNDRRYNGDMMKDDSAAQCGEYGQIGKRKEFLGQLFPASIPVRGYSSGHAGVGSDATMGKTIPPAKARGVQDAGRSGCYTTAGCNGVIVVVTNRVSGNESTISCISASESA